MESQKVNSGIDNEGFVPDINVNDSSITEDDITNKKLNAPNIIEVISKAEDNEKVIIDLKNDKIQFRENGRLEKVIVLIDDKEIVDDKLENNIIELDSLDNIIEMKEIPNKAQENNNEDVNNVVGIGGNFRDMFRSVRERKWKNDWWLSRRKSDGCDFKESKIDIEERSLSKYK